MTLSPATNTTHDLYTPEELERDPFHNGELGSFPHDEVSVMDGQPSALYRHVVLGGLDVCRRCGQAESGLSAPCVPLQEEAPTGGTQGEYVEHRPLPRPTGPEF